MWQGLWKGNRDRCGVRVLGGGGGWGEEGRIVEWTHELSISRLLVVVVSGALV